MQIPKVESAHDIPPWEIDRQLSERERKQRKRERAKLTEQDAIRASLLWSVAPPKFGAPVRWFASGKVGQLSESQARSVVKADAMIQRELAEREDAYGWPETWKLAKAWRSLTKQAKRRLDGS